MNAKEVILTSITVSEAVFEAYLADLSDEDLLIPPGPGMNPIAWQLGHLIASEWNDLHRIDPNLDSPLPANFENDHSIEAAESHDTSKFLKKSKYLDTWKTLRALSKQTLSRSTDADLEKASGVPYAPSFAALFNMMGLHPLMHAGQIVALRRKLDKPIVI